MGRELTKLEQGFKIFKWTKAVSRLMGLWSIAPNNYLFNVCMLYLTCSLVLNYILLYKSMENIEKFIEILTESLELTYIFACSLMLRVNNCKIGQVITQVIADYNDSTFKDSQEVKVFMEIINRGRFLVKGLIIYKSMGEIVWYLGPLMSSNNLIDDNNKTIFTLPYKVYLFYEIDSAKLYYLTYLCLMPWGYIIAITIMLSDCLLISLVFYISAKMAVLTMRIEALKGDQFNFKNEFNEIISEHAKLLQLGEKLRDAFNVSLLMYLVIVNFTICVLGYQMLIGITTGEIMKVLENVMYMVEIYLILGLYCVISEHFATESLRCGEAFYHCKWYNFSLECSKNIIFCIERSQKPLQLTAGKFATFSIVTLTDVTKTALSYLGVLRNFLIVN